MMMTAHMVTPRRDSAQAFSGIDYRRLHEMAAELDRPVGTMLALASDNDPFFADREQRRHGAQWFAKLWRRLRLGAGVHLRRIHYVLVIATKNTKTSRPNDDADNIIRLAASMLKADKQMSYCAS